MNSEKNPMKWSKTYFLSFAAIGTNGHMLPCLQNLPTKSVGGFAMPYTFERMCLQIAK